MDEERVTDFYIFKKFHLNPLLDLADNDMGVS